MCYLARDEHPDSFQGFSARFTRYKYVPCDRCLGFLVGRQQNWPLSEPYMPFETGWVHPQARCDTSFDDGWYFIIFFMSVDLFPFMVPLTLLGVLCAMYPYIPQTLFLKLLDVNTSFVAESGSVQMLFCCVV